MVKKSPTSKDAKAAAVQVWYGPNQSLLTLELARWRDEFRKRHPQSVLTSLSYASGNEADLAGELHQAVYGGGLFATECLVILDGFLKAEAKSELGAELKTLLTTPPQGVFILLAEGAKLAAKGLATTVRDLAEEGKLTLREFNELPPNELERWIIARAQTLGGKLSSQVARLLAAMVGSDFLQLEQEVQKLVAYRGGAEVKAADLDLLVHGRINDDVFALVEAVGRRDFVTAERVLEQQFALGASPQALVGLLTWHLRVLTSVRSALDSGGNKRSARELAQDVGLHPFVVTRALQQIPYYSLERLAWLYGELSDLDVKLKRSRVNPQVLFSVFLGKLATLHLTSRA